MKRANGEGSITKLKRALKRPYLVRVWVNDNGKRVRKNLGYYKTLQEAKKVLSEYNFNPYDLDGMNITFSELYELFLKGKEGIKSEKTIKDYRFSFNRCKPFHNMKFVEIKTPQLQLFFNQLTCSSGTKKVTKAFINQLYKLAIQLEFIQVNRANFINIGKYEKVSEKTIFTTEEIKRLWENVGNMDWVDVVLILIYMGLRITELLQLKKENVDIINGFIKGGIKTNAGENRMIPIHKDIKELIKNRYTESENEYLIYNKSRQRKSKNIDKPINYHYFEKQYKKLMTALGMEHTIHETRHTFATLSSNSGLDPTTIKAIMGHSDFTTTEKHYIHKNTETIKAEIEKIKIN